MRADLGSGHGREKMDAMSKLRIWSLGSSRCFEAVQLNRLKNCHGAMMGIDGQKHGRDHRQWHLSTWHILELHWGYLKQ